MRHLDKFSQYLILEGKPYSQENFRLFTQIIGTFLKKEFSETELDKITFTSKLPFYDINFEVKTDIKRSTRPISLSDVEEQEMDNFLSYIRRNGKIISDDFAETLMNYGNFIWQLPRKQANQAVNILKKNFPELERTMEVLIKRNTKPVTNRSQIDTLLQSIDAPTEPKKRGRKPGSKNKPKVAPLPQDILDLKLPEETINQFKREGIDKVNQLEAEISELETKLDRLITTMNREIKTKFKEAELRKRILGISD